MMPEGMNSTAIVVFISFVAFSLFITWFAARKMHSVGEFYTAGSRITGFQNGFALAGDFMSAASFLGITGLVFIGGSDAMLFNVAVAVSWAFILFAFADRMRNLGQYTFADVVAYRLHPERIRVLAAVGTLTVAIPYLIAQMVGAGALFETLFDIPYIGAVLIVGALMTIYVVFGGMIATTWIQVTKAVLLVAGATALLIFVLARFGFSIDNVFDSAAAAHAKGADIFRPGGLYKDPISILSLGLAFICGTAGLPHILMRFFTVPDAVEARKSIGYAVGIIGYFMIAIIIIGFGAIGLLTGESEYVDNVGRISGGANMVSIHLSRLVGGEVFFGLMAAVAFATILAVVAGILLSASAAVAHDFYTRVVRKGKISEQEEVTVSRWASVIIAAIAIGLSVLFKDVNVGVLATIALAVAASVNFPVIFLALFWKGLTTKGAIWGGVTGLIVVVALIILSPTVWVGVFGNAEAVFPYTYPTLFSVAAAFIVTIGVSVTDYSERARIDRDGFAAQLVKSEIG